MLHWGSTAMIKDHLPTFSLFYIFQEKKKNWCQSDLTNPN